MNIKPEDFVLEIGSGHNPKPRSDVLCDKLPEDDAQRGGKIVHDRPFIAADGQYLPFADKSFDYIISCHVLEHAENPDLFLSELMRVGKAGYIETPTEIGEKLYGWEYHKWVFKSDSDKLIIKKKTNDSQFGQLFHHLYAIDPNYEKFHTAHHNLFLIQYEWYGKIDYDIVESSNDLIDLNNIDVVKSLVAKQASAGVSGTIKGLVPSSLRQLAKGAIVKSQGRSKKTLKDIQNIIVCPKCKNKVQWHEDSILCLNCNSTYPIRNGIPYLLLTL
jgi:Zn finger protein HypA/HybF involved in hydrogenase expression